MSDYRRQPGRRRCALPASLGASIAQARVDAEHGGCRLLAGTEVDILVNGTLDLPVEVLKELDCVVAGVHSHFSDSRSKMTARIVRVLRSGVVHILSHPSGRQLGVREPYEFDFEKVLQVARDEGVALEVNAMPDRLDLTDKNCRLAKAAGVRVAISSDAHHATQLENLRYGVWVARRGWLEPRDVLNEMSLPRLRKHLKRTPRLARRRAQAELPA